MLLHSSVSGHLGSFHVPAITDYAAMNMCGHMFSILLGSIPRNGITVSYGNSMFDILRNCQTVF